MTASPVIQIDDLVKDYRALRPLRIRELSVRAGERVALLGLDAAAAETLVNLLTGAHLPDRGAVRIFGQPTAAIPTGDAWLAFLDRFGIVSGRAVLLDAMTVAQNLALPFSLEIDPIPAAAQGRVATLAGDVGLDPVALNMRLADAGELDRARVNLGRAAALAPSALILEHASARLGQHDAAAFAADIVRVAVARSLTVVAITADLAFARAVGTRTLMWDARTGELRDKRRWWR